MKQILLIVASMLSLGGLANAATTRPTDAHFKTCITSDCHTALKKTAVVHAPVASDACDSCHELKSAKEHTFNLIRSGGEMCSFCHDFDVSAMPVIHKPVANGECIGCHDPHGSKLRGLLREESVVDLCGRCHESVTRGREFVHTPVARGECDTCHPPHASRLPKLLDAAGTDLCFACHKDLEARMAKAKFSHKAMEKGGCEKCHNVHASDRENELTAAAPELCTQCHEPVKNEMAAATVKHSVASEDRSCLTCHAPHGSDYVALAADVPSKICMGCHEKKMPGLEIGFVPEVNDPKQVKHGPIRDGQCSGCHAPHGATREALLTKQYSEKFYHVFDSRQYELCFSCHDARLATQPLTATATEFRNGNKNLHFLHINEGDKGRGCSVCHAVHAAPNDRLMRPTMRFGQRDLPISFVRTLNGGACRTGCHVTYEYDRNQAIAPTTQPTTRPLPIVARAELQQPVRIEWNGSAISGKAVHLPSLDRPTVVVMLRSGQSETLSIQKQILAALNERPPAQVAVIVSGINAVAQCRAMRANVPPSWQVIADPRFAIADQFNVRGWPTTLLLRPDGLCMARIGGTPESLPLRLATYLDAAPGKTAVATESPEDSAKKAAEQRIRTVVRAAQKLIAQDKPEVAERLLTGALKQYPRNADLLLMQARSYIAQTWWDEARVIVADVVQSNPTSREAHLLLAQIYEHQQNWQAAAQEYKAAFSQQTAASPPPDTNSRAPRPAGGSDPPSTRSTPP